MMNREQWYVKPLLTSINFVLVVICVCECMLV
jgi:hypothetical protein